MGKLSRGSVLVYTLLILMVLLVSGMALATVVLVQQRGAVSTGSSLNAFQAANDGFEDLTAKYESNTDVKLSDLGTCTDGTVTIPGNANIRGYTATFTNNGNAVTCDKRLSEVNQVKVVATVGSSTRAIETAFGTSNRSPSR